MPSRFGVATLPGHADQQIGDTNAHSVECPVSAPMRAVSRLRTVAPISGRELLYHSGALCEETTRGGVVRRLVAVAVFVLLAGACSEGDGATSSTSTAVAPGTAGVAATTPPATAAPPSTQAPSTQATSTTVVEEPGPLFPAQVELPLGVVVGGAIYDLSRVPARRVADLGQAGLPFAGGPMVTPSGLLVATGASYEATLILVPSEGGESILLAEGVGSYTVSPDGSRVAWSQPWQGSYEDAAETSLLVEADLASGEVLRSTLFVGFPIEGTPTWGFADVITYVGDNVLLMTGDGAVASAAVWVPGDDLVVQAFGYGAHSETDGFGDRIVLTSLDGPCGVVVTVLPDGTVTPADGYAVTETMDCWTSEGPVYSPDGSLIVSWGTDGETGPPVIVVSEADGTELRRVPISGVADPYLWVHQITWLDDKNLVFLGASWENRSNGWDENYGIYGCFEGITQCGLLQRVNYQASDFNQVAMLGSLADTDEFALPELPSQTAAAARRDGVLAEVAAMPLADRMVTLLTADDRRRSWVLSRIGLGGCGLGDAEGIYGVNFVCEVEYGEVLLLDRSGRIARAYPMPGLIPSWIHLTEEAVYAGRIGDGGLPDATIVRIDRSSYEMVGMVFPPPEAETDVVLAIRDGVWLPGWRVADDEYGPEGPVLVTRDPDVIEGGVAVDSWVGPVYIDIEAIDALLAAQSQ